MSLDAFLEHAMMNLKDGARGHFVRSRIEVPVHEENEENYYDDQKQCLGLTEPLTLRNLLNSVNGFSPPIFILKYHHRKLYKVHIDIQKL